VVAWDQVPAAPKVVQGSNRSRPIGLRSAALQSFGVLYCFFVIAHDRRSILHCNITRHPTSAWSSNNSASPFLMILRRDICSLIAARTLTKKSSAQSRPSASNPSEPASAARGRMGLQSDGVGNCRRDLLDHVIVLNERHLKQLMSEYIRYYHDDRTHLALAKGTPAGRGAKTNPNADCKVVSTPRLGGLHHRYDCAA
jgi:putative transposase